MWRDLREDLRLVRLHPQQLGQREVGQRRIAGQLDQPLVADLFRQPVALAAASACRTRSAPAAAPAPALVQHHRAVHLSGQRRWPQSARCGSGALLSAPRIASCAARHQSSGSCSAHPGCSVRNGACSLDAPPISFPSPSTTTARVPPVPTSIPRNHIPVLPHA